MEAGKPNSLREQAQLPIEKEVDDWDRAAIPLPIDEVIMAGQAMPLSPVAMEVTGRGEITDLMVFDGLYEIFYGYHIGVTAENIVSLYGISRQEQDELSVLSHERARKAIAEGSFQGEIIPITFHLKATFSL